MEARQIPIAQAGLHVILEEGLGVGGGIGVGGSVKLVSQGTPKQIGGRLTWRGPK